MVLIEVGVIFYVDCECLLVEVEVVIECVGMVCDCFSGMLWFIVLFDYGNVVVVLWLVSFMCCYLVV